MLLFFLWLDNGCLELIFNVIIDEEWIVGWIPHDIWKKVDSKPLGELLGIWPRNIYSIYIY